jgi:hypothetical protein
MRKDTVAYFKLMYQILLRGTEENYTNTWSWFVSVLPYETTLIFFHLYPISIYDKNTDNHSSMRHDVSIGYEFFK